jgi:hypothetical protein
MLNDRDGRASRTAHSVAARVANRHGACCRINILIKLSTDAIEVRSCCRSRKRRASRSHQVGARTSARSRYDMVKVNLSDHRVGTVCQGEYSMKRVANCQCLGFRVVVAATPPSSMSAIALHAGDAPGLRSPPPPTSTTRTFISRAITKSISALHPAVEACTIIFARTAVPQCVGRSIFGRIVTGSRLAHSTTQALRSRPSPFGNHQNMTG